LAGLNLAWLTSRAALPLLRNASRVWKPRLAGRAAALADDLASVAPDAFLVALDAEARRRADTFLAGVATYRSHLHRRAMPEPPVAWSAGTTRLLDYGGGEAGRPVLVVPSLINRAYILDLAPRRSLMRHLAGAGLRPFLLDWGAPGAAERGFTLDDYIAGRLEAALDAVRRRTGRRPVVVGYCMGGLLALALAARRGGDVAALALLATPWDFQADGQAQVCLLAAFRPLIETLVTAAGSLPVNALQAMFAGIAPFQTTDKFIRFAGLAPGSVRAREFVVLEDWVNDGVPLAGPVARECLFGWYVENRPLRGEWRIGGRPVRPAEVACPALVVLPSQDVIVPPAAARPLAEALPNAQTLTVAAGHIGMVAGGRAVRQLYAPLVRWLAETPD
jgi:polyhydroxyalkanoate synthase